MLRFALSMGLILIAIAESRGQDATDVQVRAEGRSRMIARLDELVAARMRTAGFEAAPQGTDEEFVRRIYLDLTGAIPRVAEAMAFVHDEQPDKRARLIDALLDSPAHATHMANTWRNIMLPGGLNLDQINNV